MLEELKNEINDCAYTVDLVPDTILIRSAEELFRRAEATLNTCHHLLIRNSERRSSILGWHLVEADRVVELRDDLRGHVSAIGLVVAQLHLHISRNMQGFVNCLTS